LASFKRFAYFFQKRTYLQILWKHACNRTANVSTAANSGNLKPQIDRRRALASNTMQVLYKQLCASKQFHTPQSCTYSMQRVCLRFCMALRAVLSPRASPPGWTESTADLLAQYPLARVYFYRNDTCPPHSSTPCVMGVGRGCFPPDFEF